MKKTINSFGIIEDFNDDIELHNQGGESNNLGRILILRSSLIGR